MAESPNRLGRLEKLLDVLDGESVQPQELIELSESLLGIVKANQQTLLSQLQANDSDSQDRLDQVKRDITASMQGVDAALASLRENKVSKQEIEAAHSNFQKEIDRIAALIPVLPDEFDATDIYETLEDHREVVKNLSELILGENIRNALETLPEGEKLAIDAIEGLRDELNKRIQNAAQTTAIVARKLYQFTDITNASTATDGQVLTANGDGTFTFETPSGGVGSGDMTKAVYDTNNDGIVDIAATVSDGAITNAKIANGTIDEIKLDASTNASLDLADSALQPTGVGSALTLARVSGSTYSTVQHLQDIFHSAGVATGGTITDDTDGTITVSSGTGFIRGTDSSVSEVLYTDWAAEAGANVALTDNDMNYVYVEYNSGTPRVIATITKREDEHTNIFLGTVYRAGTKLYITETTRVIVGDHALNMIKRLRDTMPFQRVSGGVLSGTGTRNIAVTAGDWWEDLTEFTTAALDTSVSGSFIAYYSDGSGGWTAQTSQTQINNTQYDDGSGTLATLSNAKYATHWVYLGQDGAVYSVFGTTNGTLTEANDAGVPSSVPPWFEEAYTRLIGKIVIQKSAASFTSVQSVFNGQFSLESATDHGGLTGLSDDDHTQYAIISSQAGAPSSTPSRVGALNVDTTDDIVYVSTGTASSADWTVIGRTEVTATELSYLDGATSNIQTQLDAAKKKRFAVRLVAAGTDVATGTTVGGDYRIYDGAITITGVGAYVDTAGTTGVSTIDINEAGTTILSTKVTIDSAEKTSETAATAPVISDSAIAADGIITFDVDGVSTTAPQGLVVWVDYTIN